MNQLYIKVLACQVNLIEYVEKTGITSYFYTDYPFTQFSIKNTLSVRLV